MLAVAQNLTSSVVGLLALRALAGRRSRPQPAGDITEAVRSPEPPYRLLLFLILALTAAGSVLIAIHHGGLDDAFISYRYARHLAAGEGLVYNPGERVEGFSNLLYILMLAPAFRLGLEGDAIYAFSVALNLLASLLTLTVFASYLRSRFGARAALAGTLLLAGWPTLWYWNSTGMETAWMLLFQMVAWISVARVAEGEDRRAEGRAAGAAALCALMRSDGFVVPALLALYLFLRGRRRAALALGAAAGLTTLGVIVWQWCYYGQALANPYYVKVCGPFATRLSVAFQMLAQTRTLWLYWLMLGLSTGPALLAWARTRDLGRLPAGAFVSLGLLVYYLAIGGDFLGERFLLLQAPVAVCGLFAANLLPPRGLRLPAVWMLGTVLLYQAAVPTNGTIRLQELLLARDKQMQGAFWAELGRYLRQHEPGKTLAIDAAGLAPFYSGLYTIDMLGLCDQHIAHLPPSPHFVPGHSKYDPHYLMVRRPDLIAAWTTNDQGDLTYGLSRAVWKDAYRLKYLVYAENALPPPGSPYVLDASRLTPTQVALRFREGYRYLVLARKGPGRRR